MSGDSIDRIVCHIARQFKDHQSSISFDPTRAPLTSFGRDHKFCFVWKIDPEHKGGIGHVFVLTNYHCVQNYASSVLTVKMFDSLSSSHSSVSKELALSMAGMYVYHQLFCLVIEHAHLPSFTT